jgi:hypothetical protein
MNKLTILVPLAAAAIILGCDEGPRPTADQVQSQRQEVIQAELASQMGMPSIKNGAEMRLLKMIYEMRDQNRATFTYTFSEYTGKFRFLGNTVGFGIPYAAQYSSPTKYQWMPQGQGTGVWKDAPQSEPNGLFMPAAAEGTWVLMKDPNSNDVLPVYLEPRITVSPFKLPANIVEGQS